MTAAPTDLLSFPSGTGITQLEYAHLPQLGHLAMGLATAACKISVQPQQGPGMADADILSVIDTLYAAALEPERWEEALAAVSEAVGAIGTSIVPVGGGSGSMASRSLFDANVAYQQTWWRHDTPTARILTRGLKPGAVGTDRLVMDEDEVKRDPFYQEFLRSYGIGSSLAAFTPLASGGMFSIAAQRSFNKDPYQREDVEVMATLSPHIGRALSVAMALTEARRMANNLADAVDRLAWGVILLDADGRVRQVNGTAIGLLGDGFTIIHQRPRASLRGDDARLQAAIKAALPDSLLPSGGGVLIRRPSGGAPLYAEAVPIRSRPESIEVLSLGAGGAMLLVRSLEVEAKNVAQHLRTMGLTPAEVRLAEAIGSGATLRAAADAHGIAYETARTHLRSVFAKLGIQRQADLVALVTRLSAHAPGR